MAPDPAKYLWDALQAAERAGRFVQSKTFADYLQDEMLRSAVERQLEIVGEALGQLRKADPATAATIPDLPQAVALRNVLVHAYATVNDKLVWGVVEQHLAPLCERMRMLLNSVE
ncbi:HepT-like ribonuclease domain-containing protein [Paucibacter soli]|uniref:HepT-like ribonuclease domain-containing protein n=1 Tax=Paucibacter soli TaxID=3133433 RepID=UPI0030B51AF1